MKGEANIVKKEIMNPVKGEANIVKKEIVNPGLGRYPAICKILEWDHGFYPSVSGFYKVLYAELFDFTNIFDLDYADFRDVLDYCSDRDGDNGHTVNIFRVNFRVFQGFVKRAIAKGYLKNELSLEVLEKNFKLVNMKKGAVLPGVDGEYVGVGVDRKKEKK